MASTVYFAGPRARGPQDNRSSKVARLFDAAGFREFIGKNTLTAIKLHFGERGSDTFTKPVHVRAVVDKVKDAGGKPFLTDTNTLYAGSRHNAVDHLETAERHGFGFAAMGAPLLIADGLLGDNEKEVGIPGRHFQTVRIAGAIVRAEAMIVVSHFKGHELAGFGGAIKNLAMGCATGAGKRDQHSPRFTVTEDDCIGCGECERVCPAGAARVGDEGKATIDKELCIGCGECYIHCPEKAVDLDWGTAIPPFMERMAEYALGAVQGKHGKVGFINFLYNVTPDCDCLPWSDSPIVADIGILASTDPVALDQACLDLVNRQPGLPGSHLSCNLGCGENKFKGLWPHTEPELQLSYGETIGLGSREYTLVEL